MKKLGVFGGSFDPIHLGHLLLAEAAWEALNLDKLLFIPAQRSPWKIETGASPEQRWEMTKLAVDGRPGFEVSRLELDRTPPSFTIDTLEALRLQFHEHELWLIIGADAIGDFPLWHRSGEILAIAHLAVGQRPGETVKIPPQLTEHSERVCILPGPCCDISSTEIRQRIAENRSIHYRVPSSVIEYIQRNRLY